MRTAHQSTKLSIAKEVMPAKEEKKNHAHFLPGSAVTAWDVDIGSIFEWKCLKRHFAIEGRQ